MSGSRPGCPFLAECVDAYRRASARAAALRARLTPTQLTWRPDEDRWSVVECVEHLNRTVARQIEKMRVGVLEARSRGHAGGAPPFGKGTWPGRFVLWAMAKPWKVSAPRAFDPIHAELDPAGVFDDFRATNQELVRLALEADGLDLGRTKVGSAPTDVLKVTLAQAFRIHALNHHRHLDQAEALTELDAFPS